MLLAVAMVFTMNTTVFASELDGNNDATTTEAAAETPAADAEIASTGSTWTSQGFKLGDATVSWGDATNAKIVNGVYYDGSKYMISTNAADTAIKITGAGNVPKFIVSSNTDNDFSGSITVGAENGSLTCASGNIATYKTSGPSATPKTKISVSAGQVAATANDKYQYARSAAAVTNADSAVTVYPVAKYTDLNTPEGLKYNLDERTITWGSWTKYIAENCTLNITSGFADVEDAENTLTDTVRPIANDNGTAFATIAVPGDVAFTAASGTAVFAADAKQKDNSLSVDSTEKTVHYYLADSSDQKVTDQISGNDASILFTGLSANTLYKLYAYKQSDGTSFATEPADTNKSKETVKSATASLTVTSSKDIYYGEISDTADDYVTVKNAAGTKLNTVAIGFYRNKADADSNSDNALGVDLKTVSANDEVYVGAKYTDKDGKVVSANALKMVVKARPIKLEVNTAFSSDRFAAVKTASFNATNASNYSNAVAVDGGTSGIPTYSGDANDKSKVVALVSGNLANSYASLDTTNVDKNTPKDYICALKNIKTKTTNYVIDDSSYGTYTVNAVYTVHYVIAYKGTKQISSNIIKASELSGKTAVKASDYKITTSWNKAGFTGTDKIVGWMFKDANYGDATIGGKTKTDNFDETVNLNTYFTTHSTVYDLYLYAIVQGYGTDNVYVQTIAPVTYTGLPHVSELVEDTNGDTTYDYSGSKSHDLNIVLMGASANSAHDDEAQLVEGKDYTVKYYNNTNASVYYDSTVSTDAAYHQLYTDKQKNKRPYVVITGTSKGSYKNMKMTLYYDILPLNIDNVAGESVYSSNYDNFTSLRAATSSISGNWFKIGKNGGIKYNNVLTSYKYKSMNDEWNNKYSRVTLKKGNAKTPKDYTEQLYYKNSVDVDTKTDAKSVKTAGEYTLRVTGHGNYYGTKDITIHAATLLFKDLGAKATNVSYKAAGYSVADFKPQMTKKYNKNKLVLGTDFTATLGNGSQSLTNGKAVQAGTYTITFAPTGTLATVFNGQSVTKTVTVKGKNLPNAFSFDQKSGQAWAGSKVTAKLVVDGKKIAATDYTASATSLTFDGPGTHTITITGKNQYAGQTKPVTFVVKGAKIAESNVVFTAAKKSTTSVACNVNGTFPEITVTNVDKSTTVITGNGTFSNANNIYTARYSNNTKPGTGKVTIKCGSKACYTGSITLTYTITQAKLSAAIPTINRYDYDVTTLTPGVFYADVQDIYNAKNLKASVAVYQVNEAGTAIGLVPASNYTVTLPAKTTSGNNVLTIAGKSDKSVFTTASQKTVDTFAIFNSKDKIKVTISDSNIAKNGDTYNGAERKPKVKVMAGSTELKEGSQFVAYYSNNINVGKATVTVVVTTPGTKYANGGVATATFKINPQKNKGLVMSK